MAPVGRSDGPAPTKQLLLASVDNPITSTLLNLKPTTVIIIVVVVFHLSQYHSSLLKTLVSHLLSLSSSNRLTIRKTLPLLSTSVSTAFLSSSSSTTMDKHVEPEQTADADKGDTLVLEEVSVISTMDDSLLMAHPRTMLGRSLSRPCSRPSRQSSKNRSGWNLPIELLYCLCSMHVMKRSGIRPSLD